MYPGSDVRAVIRRAVPTRIHRALSLWRETYDVSNLCLCSSLKGSPRVDAGPPRTVADEGGGSIEEGGECATPTHPPPSFCTTIDNRQG